MSKYRNRILLVCPADLEDTANAAAEQTLGPGHGNTFTSGYSASGQAPATHYAACSAMTDGMIPQLVALAMAFPTIQAWVDGPGDFSSLAGLVHVHVGDFQPLDALSQLGLRPLSN